MFTDMLERVKTEVVTVLARVQLKQESDVEEIERRQREASQADLQMQHASANAAAEPLNDEPTTFVRQQPKVGRNEPCPCGSGKKYKQCHGKLS